MKLTRMISAAALTALGLALAAPAAAGPADRGASIHMTGGRDGGYGQNGRYDGDDWRYRQGRSGGNDWRPRHDRRHDRHHGWERGHHYGWDRGHARGHPPHGFGRVTEWHPHRHPRARDWVGRYAPRGHVTVVYNYGDYDLPPPRRGDYYARVDNDVFLIAGATQRILEAFVLLDAAAR